MCDHKSEVYFLAGFNAPALELLVELAGIWHPDVGVPAGIGMYRRVGVGGSNVANAAVLNNDASSLNHDERRRLAPVTVKTEPEFVAVKLSSSNDIRNDEIGSDTEAIF